MMNFSASCGLLISLIVVGIIFTFNVSPDALGSGFLLIALLLPVFFAAAIFCIWLFLSWAIEKVLKNHHRPINYFLCAGAAILLVTEALTAYRYRNHPEMKWGTPVIMASGSLAFLTYYACCYYFDKIKVRKSFVIAFLTIVFLVVLGSFLLLAYTT